MKKITHTHNPSLMSTSSHALIIFPHLFCNVPRIIAPKIVVLKLWPLGQIWPTDCFVNKMCFVNKIGTI